MRMERGREKKKTHRVKPEISKRNKSVARPGLALGTLKDSKVNEKIKNIDQTMVVLKNTIELSSPCPSCTSYAFLPPFLALLAFFAFGFLAFLGAFFAFFTALGLLAWGFLAAAFLAGIGSGALQCSKSVIDGALTEGVLKHTPVAHSHWYLTEQHTPSWKKTLPSFVNQRYRSEGFAADLSNRPRCTKTQRPV